MHPIKNSSEQATVETEDNVASSLRTEILFLAE